MKSASTDKVYCTERACFLGEGWPLLSVLSKLGTVVTRFTVCLREVSPLERCVLLLKRVYLTEYCSENAFLWGLQGGHYHDQIYCLSERDLPLTEVSASRQLILEYCT